jgi:hypothetical protein
MEKTRNVCKIFGGKLERKRPFGRRRRIWEDKIRLDRWESVEMD